MQEETRDPAICVGQQVGSEQESPPDALPSPHSTDPGLRAVAFCTASNAQKKKLETIQAQALRICCGAAHGTATSAVQNECREMPLHLRWLGDSVKEGVKIVTSKDHASTEVMMDHWSLHMDKFQEGKEPLFQRTKEFFDLSARAGVPGLAVLEEQKHQDRPVTDELHRQEDRVACNPEDALSRAHRHIPEPHLHIHGRVQVRRHSCSSSCHPGHRLQKNPETGGLVQCICNRTNGDTGQYRLDLHGPNV